MIKNQNFSYEIDRRRYHKQLSHCQPPSPFGPPQRVTIRCAEKFEIGLGLFARKVKVISSPPRKVWLSTTRTPARDRGQAPGYDHSVYQDGQRHRPRGIIKLGSRIWLAGRRPHLSAPKRLQSGTITMRRQLFRLAGRRLPLAQCSCRDLCQCRSYPSAVSGFIGAT
jgi:hypothetical protein